MVTDNKGLFFASKTRSLKVLINIFIGINIL